MPYQLSGDYPPVPGLPSSWRPSAEPSRSRLLLSWSPLIRAGERLLKIICAAGTRKIQADEIAPLAPDVGFTRNARCEIMRIEARRRI